MLKLLVALNRCLQHAALAPVLEQNEILVQRQEEAMQVNKGKEASHHLEHHY